MTEATTDALQQMARHVATQLVVDALKDMVANVPSLPVTVTLHPQRLLPPAPVPKRRGRKPGPKPGRKSKGSSSSGRTRVSKTRNVGSSPTEPAIDAAGKCCRHCFRRGTAVVVSGRLVRCSHCKHEWKLRATGVSRPAPAVEKDRCTRCDHTKDEHDVDGGKCLSFRCSCTGFYR